LEIDENSKKGISKREISAENVIFVLIRPKIWTWTNMPLKVSIIGIFKRLLSDYSLAHCKRLGLTLILMIFPICIYQKIDIQDNL
jgi:hypothetical protein